ncbi:MAG: triose-phosphate isomerase [Candidatus Thermoplasmatota archaeon]|nr:triose-phosphate isomerase [Candidatus Thermoplasmatota archaeon]MBU1940594.1 triose-phosphate isomerase [Candidatus Thermoplasmatota archaeon]
MLSTPTIVVNVKTYLEATASSALQLTQLMNTLASETGASLALAVQATDIYQCAHIGKLPIFSQHIDPITPGSHTGWTLPQAVVQAGAQGTLINHSEHRLTLADIDLCVTLAKKHHLDHIICTNNVTTSKAAATLTPQFIAIEPPELIGGDISVTTANPDIVAHSVRSVKAIDKKIHVLCGAGVKNGNDVTRAIELGSDGVLLASGVVKPANKEEILRDLISGLP